MELEHLSKYLITISRCDKDLTIRSLKNDDSSESLEKYQLSSLFSLLEEGKIGRMHEGLYNVTHLDLSYCDLTVLPKALKLLHLKELNLSHNQLSTVPSCLYAGGLQTLQTLDLSFNLLGHFDVEPDCISCLKVLQINNNLFSNLPKWFLSFRCTALEELNYSENKAEHYNFLWHNCKFSLMRLRKLELACACLVDSDARWLGRFKNLEYLDISNSNSASWKNINKLKDLSNMFANPLWHNMTTLKLNHLHIAFFPEGIFWITTLTELYINNNLLSWFPKGLEYLVNLEVLDVSCNELIVLPVEIETLSKLKIVIAYNNHLDDIPLMPHSLEILDLYDNYIETFHDGNHRHIMLIDVDANPISPVDLGFNHEEYCLQRDKLRILYQCQDRVNGPKPKNFYEKHSSPYSSTESDIEEADCSNENNVQYVSNNEDWDLECKSNITSKNPDISLSDDEFQGEDTLNRKCSKHVFNPYCDDEDWLFVDAD